MAGASTPIGEKLADEAAKDNLPLPALWGWDVVLYPVPYLVGGEHDAFDTSPTPFAIPHLTTPPRGHPPNPIRDSYCGLPH